MMTTRMFLAAMGFAFVAVWIGFNFGYAVLCVVGAVVFYVAGIYLEGVIDVDELRERLTSQTARRQPASSFRRSGRALG